MDAGGWAPQGFRYGMGLIQTNATDLVFANGTHATWTDYWGHPGADWGSISVMIGYWPALNVSMALGSNSIGPMNFTANSTQAYPLQCRLLNAVASYIGPQFGTLAC
uniref:Uncharacterized protein n=1 Tax=Lotharella oceanica TaxID=641309 RepID=A0A7S2TPF2_9EUKA